MGHRVGGPSLTPGRLVNAQVRKCHWERGHPAEMTCRKKTRTEENVVCSRNISWAAELRQRVACGYRAV